MRGIPRTFDTTDPRKLKRDLELMADALRSVSREAQNPYPDGTLAGQVWTWDGAKAAWDSSGVGAIDPFTDLFNPIGCWPMVDGSLTEIIAGNHLTLETGTYIVADIIPGKLGIYLDGSTRFSVSSAVAGFLLTGAMSVAINVQLDANPSAESPLVSHGAAGVDADSANNTLYQLSLPFTTSVPPKNVRWFHEHGAGVNAQYDTATTGSPARSLPPIHNLFQWVAVRDSAGVVQNYVNGRAFGAASSALTLPTGGANGRLRVGGNAAANASLAVLLGVALFDKALTADQIRRLYNATYGPGFGLLEE